MRNLACAFLSFFPYLLREPLCLVVAAFGKKEVARHSLPKLYKFTDKYSGIRRRCRVIREMIITTLVVLSLYRIFFFALQ